MTEYGLVWTGPIAPPAPFATSVPGPSAAVRSHSVTLTSAQIKNLVAAPVAISPVVEAGKFVRPKAVYMSLVLPGGSAPFNNASGAAFGGFFYQSTGNTGMQWNIGHGAGYLDIGSKLSSSSSVSWEYSFIFGEGYSGARVPFPTNTPLVFGANVASVNFGGQADGLATLKITLDYIATTAH